MEEHEIRRENLRRLIDERFHENQSELADAIDRQASYLSRCLTGKKNIGEGFARHIEKKIGLPRNWMDQHLPGNAFGEPAKPIPLRLVEELTDESRGDSVAVPVYDVEQSSNGENVVTWNRRDDQEMVDLSQKIFERKQSDPTKCKAVIMRGNAMAPEIKDEDRVVIDTTKTRVYDDGVFAVMINGDLFIRRVLRLPGGGFKLLADKDPRLTQEVTADMADSVTILGEMIWRGG